MFLFFFKKLECNHICIRENIIFKVNKVLAENYLAKHKQHKNINIQNKDLEIEKGSAGDQKTKNNILRKSGKRIKKDNKLEAGVGGGSANGK